MFYGEESYNYTNKDMELLHNLEHNWPHNTAKVVLSGMLVNTTGWLDGFMEANLDLEHLNKNIKGQAHESNTSSALLEKIKSALREAQHLTQQACTDLGIEELN